MTEATRKPVPAVQHVLEIFQYLQETGNKPQALSSIARGAGLNVSTCFNVLKTLLNGDLIAFDPATKEYQLGPRLAELGALVDVQRHSLQVALEEARQISIMVGLGCFVLALSEHEEFVVLDKVESRNRIRTTIDVGATFPAVGSLASKAWFAWQSTSVIDDIITRHDLRPYTKRSITSLDEFKEELAAVRKRGYATSEGEYYPDHNAVAAPVFGWDGKPQLLFIVVATTSKLCGPDLTRVGEQLCRAADSVTKKLNGRHPRDLP
jgi:DNA-binding IclR family transcriptional regulator